ncbi:MAG: hypothetical protein II453_16925 [Alphaproteobacteria bacterium]|nr:hypothetical protein [Alphaproteobacteria bacterium]
MLYYRWGDVKFGYYGKSIWGMKETSDLTIGRSYCRNTNGIKRDSGM